MTGHGGSSQQSPLRFLIDSNVFIALEPYAGQLEPAQEMAARLIRYAAELHHRVYVHPATRDDLLQGQDVARREQRLAELAKFMILQDGPVPAALTAALGSPAEGSNDHRDMRLLAAVHRNAVSYLVTEDAALRRRAAKVGLSDRVISLQSALDLLEQLMPVIATPPPKVSEVASYNLDEKQVIFDSLRDDYGTQFDDWLQHKVRPDHENRDCLVVEQDGAYAALAIVKQREDDCVYPFPHPVTKLATFKVDAGYRGSKYGELLLKSMFMTADARRTASIYVEVLPHHDGLVTWFNDFGFVDSGQRTERGEHVLLKQLRSSTSASGLAPLDFHVAYGPPAVSGAASVYVVPIEPRWFAQLFPDAPALQPEPSGGQQLELELSRVADTHPWGNALRKAYLCHSKTTKLKAGDTLLFYESHGPARVSAVGVVERVLRSADPTEVLGVVAGRTVYTPDEVDSMCRRAGGVLAILFRQDRFIDPPWSLAELRSNGVLRGWPQSITRVREAGTAWVHGRLAE